MKRETRGKVEKVKGRSKEAAGILTGNEALEKKGARQRTVGAIEESVGKAGRKIGEAVDKVAKAAPRRKKR